MILPQYTRSWQMFVDWPTLAGFEGRFHRLWSIFPPPVREVFYNNGDAAFVRSVYESLEVFRSGGAKLPALSFWWNDRICLGHFQLASHYQQHDKCNRKYGMIPSILNMKNEFVHFAEIDCKHLRRHINHPDSNTWTDELGNRRSVLKYWNHYSMQTVAIGMTSATVSPLQLVKCYKFDLRKVEIICWNRRRFSENEWKIYFNERFNNSPICFYRNDLHLYLLSISISSKII